MTADTAPHCCSDEECGLRPGFPRTGHCACFAETVGSLSLEVCVANLGQIPRLLAPPAPTTILFDPSDPERWTAPTTESVDDYEGWTETAFLPSVKYVVVWDDYRDGWAVLTLDDGGAFS